MQTAWVLNGSVVENVTVARDPPASSSTGGAASANLTQRIDSSQSPALDEELWARCCHAACMSTDLRLLPAGRDTEIGEKGVNLRWVGGWVGEEHDTRCAGDAITTAAAAAVTGPATSVQQVDDAALT
jgi:hypothetical protein